MILTGQEIKKQVRMKRIHIHPFIEDKVVKKEYLDYKKISELIKSKTTINK